MSLEIQQQDDTLLCAGTLDIGGAANLGIAIAANLRQYPQTVLDLSAITDSDAAGLQLLYAARKQAQIHGKGFGIRAASPALQERAAALGLSLDQLVTVSAHV